MENQHVRTVPVSIVAGISAIILAAGGGTAWWTWNSINSSMTSSQPVSTTPATTQPPSSQAVQPSNEQTVQVYWLKSTGNAITLAPNSVALNAAGNQEAILEAAFNQLLAGPKQAEFTSTIPEGTKLRDVAVRDDGVHVDLSQEFTTGGGSASMTGRLAQILYTATSVDPQAPVWISVAGEPLEILGGEGLIIDQPMTRQNFDENFTL